jgi:arylsulfatase A-like enzyme
MRFTDAYAGSTVCAPSRCCLMTGYHTGHARTRGNKYPDLPLRPQDITVTELLKTAGYRTGLFGKWSLGQLGSTGYPTRKGFDEWFGFFSQTHAHNYYPEHLLENETAWIARGNTGTQHRDYAHDLFTERGLGFLNRGGDQPFFLKLAYTIPHANNELGRDTGNGMEVPSLEPYANKDWPTQEKAFAAMVTRMDRDIGRLMTTLQATGQDFFDDNGPLRGIKRDLYEGGIRVPFLARWPGVIAPGSMSNHPIAFWDLLPTACELAQVNAPAGIDGLSFAPILRGQSARRHDFLYWEFHERGFAQAIRQGDWKAVRGHPSKPTELYNLKNDLGETRNLAGEQPQLTASLEKLFAAARTDTPDWPVKA